MKKSTTLEFPCACAAIRHAARLVTQIYEEELREHMAMPQFGLLSVLNALPGCNQATLARDSISINNPLTKSKAARKKRLDRTHHIR